MLLVHAFLFPENTLQRRHGSTREATASLWEQDAQAGHAHFYADSASSAGKYLNLLDERGWGWSVTGQSPFRMDAGDFPGDSSKRRFLKSDRLLASENPRDDVETEAQDSQVESEGNKAMQEHQAAEFA